MPVTKFDPREPTDWLAAIADPLRYAILRALAARGLTVTGLARACGVSPAVASRHALMLKAVGAVTATRDGRFQRYNLVGATATATHLELNHPSGAKVILPLV